MPVIKSFTRRNNSFGQLVNYLFDQEKQVEDDFTYLHNFSSLKEDDKQSIIQAFKHNARYRRANGLSCFHEIMSFSNRDREAVINTPGFLEDMAREYFELRCANALGVAKPHYDKQHLHLHLMFSANEIESPTSLSIRKSDFAKIKEDLQQYMEHTYPQIKHSSIAFKKHENVQSVGSEHMERRGNCSTVKASLQETILRHGSSLSLDEYTAGLEAEGLQPYYRHNILQGVVHRGRKYRIKTLLKEFPEQQENFLELQNQCKEQLLEKDHERGR